MRIGVLLLSTLFILLTGCGSEAENTPEKVVKEFAKALEEKDYDKLKSLCTTETQAMVEVYKLAGGLLSTQSNELDKNEATCRIEGDEATCLNCCLNDGSKRQYDLKKEDGVWRVVFTMNFNTATDSTLKTEPVEPEVEPIEDAVTYPSDLSGSK